MDQPRRSGNQKVAGSFRMKKRLVFTSLLMLLVATVLLMVAERGCSSMFAFRLQFRIINATGTAVAVTSAHTQQTTGIPNRAAAVVPHGQGDITIKQRGGKTWVYRNVSPGDLEGTPYKIIRHYPIPFGGGTWTVNLLLAEDGRLYVVPPDGQDADVGKLKQPEGFPLKPNEGKDVKDGMEPSSGEEKGFHQ